MAKTKAETYIDYSLSLPTEVLDYIVSLTDPASQKSIRLASKRLAAVVEAGDLFRRIIIVPDSKCIENALRSHTLFKKVQEVVYDNRWVGLDQSIDQIHIRNRIKESALGPQPKSYPELRYLTKILSSLSNPLCLTVKEYSQKQELTLNDLPPFYGWIREELKEEVLDASEDDDVEEEVLDAILPQSLQDDDVEPKAQVAIEAAFNIENIIGFTVNNHSWSRGFNADFVVKEDSLGLFREPSPRWVSILSGMTSRLRSFEIAFIDYPSCITGKGIYFREEEVAELGTVLSRMSNLKELVLKQIGNTFLEGRAGLGLVGRDSPGARWPMFELLFPTGTFYQRLETLRLEYLTTKAGELVAFLNRHAESLKKIRLHRIYVVDTRESTWQALSWEMSARIGTEQPFTPRSLSRLF